MSNLLAWLAPFVAIVLVAYVILLYYEKHRAVKKRVKGTEAAPVSFMRKPESSPLKERLANWFSSSGKWALKNEAEVSKLRSLLIRGGFRQPQAAAIFYGIRATCALLLPIPLILYAVVKGKLNATFLTMAFMVAGMGYFLPQFLLEKQVKRRQNRIDRALPDVVDLITICLEAGLAMQATINRVADEIREMCHDFYVELQLTAGEMRGGLSRDQVLRNLADRTGVQSVKSLTTLIIQSERLGTSISQALRIHADSMRDHRMLRAEEKAGQIPVKIMIPLLLFIFPAIFVVVVGPGIIMVARNLMPRLKGGL